MRNILVLCCASLFSFCVAIPFVTLPANLGDLVAIDESPHVHMEETPHTAVGSLQDVNSDAYDGQDQPAILHNARDSFFFTNTQDGGGENAKLGQEMHNVVSRCVNAHSNVQPLSRRHKGSVRKDHKALVTSKPTAANADDPHWFRLADYRRSPMLDFLREMEHPSVTSSSTESPNMEPTPTSPSHIKELKEKPAHSQGSEGSSPDDWGRYRDWKQ